MSTGIQVKMKNGVPVYARTLEFGIDLQSAQLLVSTNGTTFAGVGVRADQPGITWTSQYAMTWLSAMGLSMLTDGLNSEGLAAGAFYFTGCAGYACQSVCASGVVTYWLSTCATVAEIRAAAKSLKVNQCISPVAMPVPAVDQAFDILNSFDIPFSTVRQVIPATQDTPEQTICEHTLWTAASDTQQRKYYFHTFRDRCAHMPHLANRDFTGSDIHDRYEPGQKHCRTAGP